MSASCRESLIKVAMVKVEEWGGDEIHPLYEISNQSCNGDGIRVGEG